ncbi:hypothetical protein OH492_28205 [Vibrio chagasii]|nr:hypothetical protein [Vibrio chagasii]
MGKNRKTAVFPKLVFCNQRWLEPPATRSTTISSNWHLSASKRMYPDILNYDK